MLHFKEAEIADYGRLQEYFAKYGENSCQHSFVNLFTLSEKYGSRYCEQDGFLYVLRSRLGGDGFRAYLFPMGGGDRRRAVETLLADAHENGARLCFHTATEAACRWLLAEFPGVFEVEESRDYAEYIHLTDNIARLPGRKFEKKRYYVNMIRKQYGDRLETQRITKDMREELLAFDRRWLASSSESHDMEALELEYREMEKQLAYFDELKLSGIVVRIDHKLEGFVYGAPISADCYDALVEKGNRDIDHIYRVLHQDLARFCAAEYKYVNREEDVGVPGLRLVKLSYHPDILLKKYIVKEKTGEVTDS